MAPSDSRRCARGALKRTGTFRVGLCVLAVCGCVVCGGCGEKGDGISLSSIPWLPSRLWCWVRVVWVNRRSPCVSCRACSLNPTVSLSFPSFFFVALFPVLVHCFLTHASFAMQCTHPTFLSFLFFAVLFFFQSCVHCTRTRASQDCAVICIASGVLLSTVSSFVSIYGASFFLTVEPRRRSHHRGHVFEAD